MAPTSFTFKAYVLSVIDPKRICVRIDKDYLELVATRLTAMNDKTTIKDTLMINVNDCKFNISIDWNELTDLIGVHIKINATLRRYSFYKTKIIHDENNYQRTTAVQCRGVAIAAKSISNER